MAQDRDPLESEYFGTLPYEIFDRAELGITPRVIDFAYDQNGFLYCAHQSGILRFDRTNWVNIINLEGGLTEIDIDDSGNIYYFRFEGFGRFEPDGRNSYKRVDFDARPEIRSAAIPIQSLKVDGDKAYFIASRSVIVYDQSNDTLEQFKHTDRFTSNGAIHKGKLHLGSENRDLISLGDMGFEVAYSLSAIELANPIKHLKELENGTLAGIMEDGRLFSYDGKLSKLYQKLPDYNSRSTTSIHDKEDGSLIIVDTNDIDHYSANFSDRYRKLDLIVSDFPILTRSSIRSPDFNHLWLALDSQLIRIDLNSPINRLSQMHGIPDRPLRMLRHNGALFLDSGREILAQRDRADSTNHDEFVSVIGTRHETTQLLASCSDGVLMLVDGQLAIHPGGSDSGLINPEAAAQARGSKPYIGVNRVSAHKDYAVNIYERRNNVWQNDPFEITFDQRVERTLDFDDGSTWVEFPESQIVRIVKNDGVYKARFYTSEDGLPNQRTRVAEIDGNVFVISNSHAFSLNEENDRFELVERFEQVFSDIPNILRLWNDCFGRLWAVTPESTGLVLRLKDGRNYLDTRALDPFKTHRPMLLMSEESGKMWFTSSVGLLVCDTARISKEKASFTPIISRIERIGANELLFDHAITSAGPVRTLANDSLRFLMTTTLSDSPSRIEYRYRLDSNQDWSDWQAHSIVEVAQIKSGDHEFTVQSRTDPDHLSTILTVPFSVANPVYASPLAYSLYALGLAAFAGGMSFLWSIRYRKRSQILERDVNDRTAELQEKTRRLTSALEDLRETQSKLMDSARTAGMAEVATSVLHNVGNVMNSLSIAVGVLNNRVQKSKLDSFEKAVELITRNKDSLADFLTNDSRGARLPEYLTNLNKVLQEERSFYTDELLSITEHLQHAASIIASQQRTARSAHLLQEFNLKDSIDNALRISVSERWRKRIEISVDVPTDIDLEQDQHVLLQVITNFIKNAAESIMDAKREKGKIDIAAHRLPESESIEILVTDNGGGIDNANQSKIFTMGYTTKSYGHGFGMHAAANAVSAIGGRISLKSDGIGKGATARLELPLKVPEKRADEHAVI